MKWWCQADHASTFPPIADLTQKRLEVGNWMQLQNWKKGYLWIWLQLYQIEYEKLVTTSCCWALKPTLLLVAAESFLLSDCVEAVRDMSGTNGAREIGQVWLLNNTGRRCVDDMSDDPGTDLVGRLLKQNFLINSFKTKSVTYVVKSYTCVRLSILFVRHFLYKLYWGA